MSDTKKDKKVYTANSPTNQMPVPFEIMVVVWNGRNPDDRFNSRQAMEAACQRAEFALIRELSNDPHMRDMLEPTASIFNPTDHQRRLNRIVGLKEGMPESYADFKKGKFNAEAK